jgi:hypothetical protein
MTSRGRETWIRDIVDATIAVSDMIRGGNEVGDDGIEQKRADAAIPEHRIYEIIDRKSLFVLCVDMDAMLNIGPFGIAPGVWVTIEGSAALTVFKDNHFTVEAVGVLQNLMDQAPHHIRVGGSPALPLAIYLDQDDIVLLDQAIGPGPRVLTGRFVQANAVLSEKA